MTSFRSISILVVALISFTLSSCTEDNDLFRVDYSLAEALLFDTTGITPTTTESGLIIYQLEEGEGPLEVGIRDDISIYYTMRAESNDDVFESSYINGITTPSTFQEVGTTANNRGVGFVEGILGMKEGEKRVLVIPPNISTYSDTIIVDLDLAEILE